jgi:hypothetical protein
LDGNELGAILVASGLSSPRDHALVSLLSAIIGRWGLDAVDADVILEGVG